MSDPKDPFDPFGQADRGDRTVIRPNPGGRRPAAPPQQPPAPPPQQQNWGAPPSPPPPPNYPPQQPAQGWGAPPPVQPNAPSYDPAYGAKAPGQVDAWAERASQGRQQLMPQEAEYAAAAPSAPVVVRRDMPKPPNDNPIMAAAGPILLMLGRLRIALMQVSFASLMEQVAQAIQNFEQEVRGSSSPEQVRTAKYLVCATADDIVQNIPDQDRQLWTQYSMLARFFGDRMGGERFYEELDRLKADPSTNYPVLELQHACLALGFQGKYRAQAGGAATLQNIQRNLYETIRRVRQRASDLSPHWEGQDLANTVARVRIPFWAVASLAALLLVAMFLILRSLLSGGTDAVVDDMSRIFPTTDVVIQSRSIRPRPTTPPPPPKIETTQLERIRAGLKAEIDSGKVSVDSTPNGIYIRVGSFTSFAPGKANVLPEFAPLAKKISEILNKEPGDIRVVGHTDNTPIGSGRFSSNQELSVARAKAVADVLANTVSDKARLKTDGKGDSQPVAPNANVEGRARNRRVDVSIPHEK